MHWCSRYPRIMTSKVIDLEYAFCLVNSSDAYFMNLQQTYQRTLITKRNVGCGLVLHLVSNSCFIRPNPITLPPNYQSDAATNVVTNLPPESLSKKRKTRTVEERMQALVDDPRCDDLRPDQVHCVKCKKWVKLQKDVPYIDSNWQRHLSSCGKRTT